MDLPPMPPIVGSAHMPDDFVDLTDAGLATTGMTDSMDDLFGEAADGLGVPVPMAIAAPLPASLIYRVNDMQRIGCGSKLAWSNAGFIAQISDDSRQIAFRTVMRDQKSGSSELSEESHFPISAPDGVLFVHLQFSGLGTDLAVADSHGGVHVYSLTGVLGRMQAAPADISVNDGVKTELDAVVGLHWLPTWPIEYRVPYITPSAKVNDKWLTQMKMPDQHASRMHHALDNRNALLYITISSKLVLLYQNEQGIWHSTSTQLEHWHSSNELLSHAAMGEEGDHLVLATHDHGRRLRVYSISINWNGAQQPRSNGTSTLISPTLEIGHLTILENFCPLQARLAKLSLLRVIPAVPTFADQGTPTLTDVLAVFTHAPTPIAAVQQQQDPFRVSATLTLERVSPTLHDCFAKLKSNGEPPAQTPMTVLRRQQDNITNRIVLDAAATSHNTTVSLAGSYGTTVVTDRSSRSFIEFYGETGLTSGLAQSGLEFIRGDHTPHAAINADGSAMVVVDADGTLAMKYVVPRYGWQPLEDGISDTAAMIETAVTCLARQYAILSSASVSSASHATDEILAALPPDASKEMRAFFVKQVFRILCRSLDVAMMDRPRQQQTVLREQMHLRALSAQLALGNKPGSTERAFAGQFACAYLNMRHISITLAQTFSARDANNRHPDLVPSLLGLVKWTTDLLVFIVDSLALVKRNYMPAGTSARAAFARFIAERENPALHLLLCSLPRVLLRMQTMVIPGYLKWVQAARTRTRTLEHRRQLEEFHAMAERLPFAFTSFIDMHNEVDDAVRAACTAAGLSGEQRMEMEWAMMSEGVIPAELEPVVDQLMETILPKMIERSEMGRVYFWDTEWLGIRDSVPAERAVRYDAIRRIPLTREMKRRVCRRCGAEMEDLPREAVRQLPEWLAQGQRFCFCLGYWWAVG
ncbi:Mediator of RNA polymerase II transcription subunit 16 [Teratosphaeriaceae sp. CCFEE 6253]|nr:Mediator of RNA polymerase II transcription subunit 16 [Teratosphaeriaceae sp. CCFEE 6253]